MRQCTLLIVLQRTLMQAPQQQRTQWAAATCVGPGASVLACPALPAHPALPCCASPGQGLQGSNISDLCQPPDGRNDPCAVQSCDRGGKFNETECCMHAAVLPLRHFAALQTTGLHAFGLTSF